MTTSGRPACGNLAGHPFGVNAQWLQTHKYNNSKHSATGILPFSANNGFEPRKNWTTEVQLRNAASESYGYCMTSGHAKLGKWLKFSIQEMTKYYDKRRKSIELCMKEDLVMLNRKDIHSKHRRKT